MIHMRPNDNAEDAAVLDLTRQADHLDMMASLMVAGYGITAPCNRCDSKGRVDCSKPDHMHHVCAQEECSGCSLRRYNILRASLQAQRILHEEYDSCGNRIPTTKPGRPDE